MQDLFTSLRVTVITIGSCCVVYPLVLLLVAQLAFPHRSRGSLLVDSANRIVGSSLVAQGFKEPKYFWPRPSAVEYDASAAGGSNLSPTNPLLAERALALIARHQIVGEATIPADLVAASGSGLDPHISLAAALFQLPRVARARGLDEPRVRAAVAAAQHQPFLLGDAAEPVVNVLRLNLALDRLGVGN